MAYRTGGRGRQTGGGGSGGSPTGAAGGVLAGNYPNPTFAANAAAPSFNVTKPTASGNVSPSTSAWASGTGNTQTLVAGVSGNQYRVSNINPQGGANITIAVPAGSSFQGTANGTQLVPPGDSYTIETDGTNFILV